MAPLALLPAGAAACARATRRLFSSSRRGSSASANLVRGGRGRAFVAAPRARAVKEPETASASSNASSAPATSSSESTSSPPLAWRAAIDFKKIRDNAEATQTNANNRAASVDVSAVVAAYEAYQTLKGTVDELRERRNVNAKSMKGKMDKEKRDALIEEGKALKDELAGLEQELGALETTMQIEGQKIPNDTHPDVPIGGEEVAALRREVGAKRDFRCVPYTGSHTTASAW
jgi:seryl-tRNA synthetase